MPETHEHVMWALDKTDAETHAKCDPGLSSMHAPGIKLTADVPEIDAHMVCPPDKPATEAHTIATLAYPEGTPRE